MEEPIVTLEQGKLIGRTGTDYDGRTFYSFQGIPYAKPPLGKLRFKPPQPPEPWKGLLNATKEGNVCFQRDYSNSQMIGAEDCLYLNVYTPELPSDTNNSPKKSVMVWVHGGALTIGSGNSDTYGPEYLLINDVIVVTINYRLGLLGFLKADDPLLEIPGNAGLRDIVMALQWVKANITRFSGDPGNITLVGESAGSAAVQYVLLSPSAKGMFQKAIMQSGSVLNPWARGFQNKEQFAKILNIDPIDEKKIIETLTELSVEELLEFQEQLGDSITKTRKRPFGPTVENENKCPFLIEEPSHILSSGRYTQVPIIIGYCKREGNLSEAFANLEGAKPIHTSFTQLVPFDFGLIEDSTEAKEVAKKIEEFYYRDSSDTIHSFSTLEGDIHFINGIKRSIKMMVENSQQPIYCYRFSIDTSLNMLRKVLPITLKGASHGDELTYLFKSGVITSTIEPGSVEDLSIRRITRLWTNFAKTGNPNSVEKLELLNVEWKPITRSCLNLLDFDEELRCFPDPDGDRMIFWDDIYRQYSSKSN